MVRKKGFYEKYIKRPQDLILSLVALIILIPVLLIIAILVRINIGKPVIFTQVRPGKDEKLFKLYKFRTMLDLKDENGELLPDAMRLTRFGKFLRSTSLDELPELWNIIRGDMSIVGPRPLLVRHLPLYNDYQRRRHEVRPGLTGLAQVNGRNLLEWKDRLDQNVHYVDNISFIKDWTIIFMTIKTVLLRKGIHSANSATMERFEGN